MYRKKNSSKQIVDPKNISRRSDWLHEQERKQEQRQEGGKFKTDRIVIN